MSGHFLPQHKLWLKDGRTWAMRRSDQEVRSRINYILGTDSGLFQNVAFRDARHNTDYYLVLRCLCVAKPAAHLHYLRKRNCFPIRPPVTPDKADCMFAELRGDIPKTPQQERHR